MNAKDKHWKVLDELFQTEKKNVTEAFLEYSKLADESVAYKAKEQKSAQEYLLRKYKDFVRYKARPYFLIGGDREDLVQEGMIGLYKAIRDYDSSKNASFKTFADLCITRQMITAIKAATRKKHRPLNKYVSLNKTIDSDGSSNQTLLELLEAQDIASPEQTVLNQESVLLIEKEIFKILSALEFQVLHYHLKGYSYRKIAKVLNRNEKSIDNAFQRARQKIEEYLLNESIIVNK